jgi:hypothetical protein
MNVVLYGATGRVGRRVLSELLARGHRVTAVCRHPVDLPEIVETKTDDLSDANRIAEIIRGADAVVSAYAAPREEREQMLGVTAREIEAVKKAGNPRLIVVGGAGSLEVRPGVTVLDSGTLPEAWKPSAAAHAKALKVLRDSDIPWTYFSPAFYFEPGERTGKFRLGGDSLVADENGNSRISMEDYAIALVDELEKPAHVRARFTIGY